MNARIKPPLWRIGEGWDTHALALGRKLVLGGVEIPHTHGLMGHSDADALCHAITDALFGAAALGDIGFHFPDTDAQYKGADSVALLAEAARRVRAAGWVIANVDSTIVAQAPKMRRTSSRCASVSRRPSAWPSIRSASRQRRPRAWARWVVSSRSRRGPSACYRSSRACRGGYRPSETARPASAHAPSNGITPILKRNSATPAATAISAETASKRPPNP